MRENRNNAPVISNPASASKEANPVVSDPLHPNQGELGEVDACENSIDGMGAINFTDEEDCGFFGMPHAVNHVMEYILTGLQAHHRISPLCVIFRVQSHETMVPVPAPAQNPDQDQEA